MREEIRRIRRERGGEPDGRENDENEVGRE
jgi:hypothetical protein